MNAACLTGFSWEILIGRIAMQWETPEFEEISLACEISGYANAELSVANPTEAKASYSSREF